MKKLSIIRVSKKYGQNFSDGCPFCPVCPLDVEVQKIEATRRLDQGFHAIIHYCNASLKLCTCTHRVMLIFLLLYFTQVFKLCGRVLNIHTHMHTYSHTYIHTQLLDRHPVPWSGSHVSGINHILGITSSVHLVLDHGCDASSPAYASWWT
jgi:hypothetical protein